MAIKIDPSHTLILIFGYMEIVVSWVGFFGDQRDTFLFVCLFVLYFFKKEILYFMIIFFSQYCVNTWHARKKVISSYTWHQKNGISGFKRAAWLPT
jgi:hypothetical protein